MLNFAVSWEVEGNTAYVIVPYTQNILVRLLRDKVSKKNSTPKQTLSLCDAMSHNGGEKAHYIKWMRCRQT